MFVCISLKHKSDFKFEGQATGCSVKCLLPDSVNKIVTPAVICIYYRFESFINALYLLYFSKPTIHGLVCME